MKPVMVNSDDKKQEIISIEFSPTLYPKYAEVGRLYAAKNEIIHKIIESEATLFIYTDSCGINYGTPINIQKKDVCKITYAPVKQDIPILFI